MKIQIVMEVEDEYADPRHDTGLTNKGYDKVFWALSPVGYDIEVVRQDD